MDSTTHRLQLSALLYMFHVLSGVLGETCEPNEFMAHPFDCSSFYLCDGDNYPHHFICPRGLHFNPSTSCCDWPENAQCVDSSQDSDNYEERYADEDTSESGGLPYYDLDDHPKEEKLSEEVLNSEDTVVNHQEHFYSTDDLGNNAEENAELNKYEYGPVKRDTSDQEYSEEKEDLNKPSSTSEHSDEEYKDAVLDETAHENISHETIYTMPEDLASLIHILSQVPAYKSYEDLGYKQTDDSYDSAQKHSGEDQEETALKKEEDEQDTFKMDHIEENQDTDNPSQDQEESAPKKEEDEEDTFKMDHIEGNHNTENLSQSL